MFPNQQERGGFLHFARPDPKKQEVLSMLDK